MKLPVLFAKYLYQHKQLQLPGIGVFQLDPAVTIPDPADKNQGDIQHHIRYTQQPVLKPEEAFIEFIRAHTGKIRPLAESDLDSYLEDGRNMLNIGKPFHLEGIGSLHKIKGGVYEFKPGEPLMERLETHEEKDNDHFRRNKTAYEERYNPSSQNAGFRKMLIAAGVLIGIAAVVWGGYSLYNKNADDNNVIESESVGSQPPVINTDSLERVRQDSLNLVAQAADDGTYRFVIETTESRARAMKRFNQLKSLGTTIQMETTDSIQYKLYYTMKAQPADTIRIKDSLRLRYGRRVTVEK